MKITVLIENTAAPGFAHEHGLSLWIEREGKHYLLDAGQSGAFLENARKLQIDPAEADACILSHGHYDHAGGLAAYLSRYPKAFVYAMQEAGEDYYSASGGIHAIGIPKTVLPEYEKQFRWIEAKTEIDEGVFLLPHRTKGLERIGTKAGLYRRSGEELLPDDFRHELSLVMDTEQGLVVCSSCSHAGIENILAEVEQAFLQREVYAFVGGLHMKGKCGGKEICTFSEEEIRALCQMLRQKGVRYLCTGHCTGGIGFEMLRKYLGGCVQPLTTGSVIEI